MPTYDGYYFGVDLGTASSSTVAWTTWTTTTNTVTNITYPAWDNWVTMGTYQVRTGWVAPARTPEQIEADRVEAQRQQDEWQAREQERIREREAAAVKARVILEENLTPEQRQQLADNNWFEVVTPKRTYRIRKGWAGNVDGLNPEGRITDRFCIHPSEEVPHEDNMLAQKLLLEADEDMFLRIANRSPVYA